MADVAPGGSPDQAAQPQPDQDQPQPAPGPAAAGPTGSPVPSDPPTRAFTAGAAQPVSPGESVDPGAPLGGYPASGFPAADPGPGAASWGDPAGPGGVVAPVEAASADQGGSAGDGWAAAVPQSGVVLADPAYAAVPPPVPGRRGGWPRWLSLLLVIGFIAVCAIAMLLYLGFNVGITGLAIGLVAAILPVPILVGCFLWLDRYEPEPIRYLVFCFAWGSSVATLTALAVNSGLAWAFDRIGLPDALVAVLVAPFIEESMKAAGPILLLWRRRREWSGITDGIVYCGLSAIGFAMVENVLYLGGHGYAAGADQYGPATGIQNVFLMFILRILFTGFAHPLFTSMSGIGLGISSRTADRRLKWLAPIGGLILAMILHGTFNLLPTLSAAIGQPLIMLYGYLGFMVPLFFVMVGLAISLRGWEGRLAERILPRYVQAGWLSPPEVAALGSLGRRYSARRWARRVAGESGAKAMGGFQFAATRLALVRDGMQRGLDRKPEARRQTVEEEQRLLDALVGYRAVFQGRDPQAPQAFWNGESYQIAFPDGVVRSVPAPDEPVVPVPVRLPPPPVAVAPGWPGYPPAGYASAGYASAGYASAGYASAGYAPAGYAAPQPYASMSGYGAQFAPGYAPQPISAYGVPSSPGCAAQPTSGYGMPPASGYSGQPTSGYGMPPAPGDGAQSTPGYATPPVPGYAGPPTSGYGVQSTPAPSYGGQPAPGPSYGGQPAPGPSYGGQPAPGASYGGQPAPGAGYGVQPVPGSGYGVQPGYWPGYGVPPQLATGYGTSPGSQPGPAGSGYGSDTPPGSGSRSGESDGAQQSAGNVTAPSLNPRQPAPGAYSTAPAATPPPGYTPRPASPQPTGYSPAPPDQTGPSQQPDSTPPGFAAQQPPYGSGPGQPPYGAQPGYPGHPPYGAQPGYPGHPPYGAQPGYPGQPPYGAQPGHQWQQPSAPAPAYQWQQPEPQTPEMTPPGSGAQPDPATATPPATATTAPDAEPPQSSPPPSSSPEAETGRG